MATPPLTVSLAALRRGPVRRTWRLEDPPVLGDLPEGTSPLDIELEIGGRPVQGFRARGRLRGTLQRVCRRCMVDVEVPLSAEIDVWFRPATEIGFDEEGVWPFDPAQGEIDLTEALREEVWLVAPEYVVCREDCAGLCPRCGVLLAREPCVCPPTAPDPRWARLRELVDPPPPP